MHFISYKKALKQNSTRISSLQKEKKENSFNFKIQRNVINASFYRFVGIFFYTHNKYYIAFSVFIFILSNEPVFCLKPIRFLANFNEISL